MTWKICNPKVRFQISKKFTGVLQAGSSLTLSLQQPVHHRAATPPTFWCFKDFPEQKYISKVQRSSLVCCRQAAVSRWVYSNLCTAAPPRRHPTHLLVCRMRAAVAASTATVKACSLSPINADWGGKSGLFIIHHSTKLEVLYHKKAGYCSLTNIIQSRKYISL